MEFNYEIGGSIYTQKKLVWGQWKQLLGLLPNLRLPPDLNSIGIVTALGNEVTLAMAIILNPEGTNPREKDIKAIANQIEFEITAEEIIQVIDDFFDCNPMPSLLEKLKGIQKKSGIRIERIPSTPPVASSQEVISPNGIKSSGDIAPTSADSL